MERTTSHGTRTNISQSTADHAGLKVQPLQLLTDSISNSMTLTQLQSHLTPKLLSTAELVEAVKVETQVVSMNMLTKKVSQIHLANNTLPLMVSAMRKLDAKTAPGHHAQKVKIAKTNAGLLLT
jgi:hypothetical protein